MEWQVSPSHGLLVTWKQFFTLYNFVLQIQLSSIGVKIDINSGDD